MPRPYTDQEREQIRRRLMEAAEARFTRFGLRKTTIDELVRDAGIGKGSFYQFFDSKEDLFLTLQERAESEIKSRLTGNVSRSRKGSAAQVREFFETVVGALDRHPFLERVTDPEVIGLLERAVPPERLAAHRREDAAFYMALFERWIDEGVVRGVDVETLFGVLTALFVLHQQRDTLGERFPSVVSFLVDAICRRLARGGSGSPA